MCLCFACVCLCVSCACVCREHIWIGEEAGGWGAGPHQELLLVLEGDAEGWTPGEGLGEQDGPRPLRQLAVQGGPKLAMGGLLGFIVRCVAQSFLEAGSPGLLWSESREDQGAHGLHRAIRKCWHLYRKSHQKPTCAQGQWEARGEGTSSNTFLVSMFSVAEEMCIFGDKCV